MRACNPRGVFSFTTNTYVLLILERGADINACATRGKIKLSNCHSCGGRNPDGFACDFPRYSCLRRNGLVPYRRERAKKTTICLEEKCNWLVASSCVRFEVAIKCLAGERGRRNPRHGEDIYPCLLVNVKNFLACGFRSPRNLRSRHLAHIQARRGLTWHS